MVSLRALEVTQIFMDRDRDNRNEIVELTRDEQQQEIINLLKNRHEFNLYKKIGIDRLKIYLKVFELKVSGNKQELFERLMKHLDTLKK